jgi:hypothetical protein
MSTDLRRAIFEAAAGFKTRPDSLVARDKALAGIEDILGDHPLESFRAGNLELLMLLYAYWREAEVQVGTPEPDELRSGGLH